MRGRFISVEGGEGVGKSVFSSGLAAALTARNVDLVRTFEPGGTPSADLLRDLFLHPAPDDPLVPEAEFCIVSAARAQHVGKKLRPALSAGKWVLCDRFADSARVYQGMLGKLPEAAVEAVIAFTTSGLEPDLTFVLDCDVSVSMQRLEKRWQAQAAGGAKADASRFDKGKLAFHENIRQCFLELARRYPQRLVVLDAAQPPAATIDAAVAVVRQRFSLTM